MTIKTLNQLVEQLEYIISKEFSEDLKREDYFNKRSHAYNFSLNIIKQEFTKISRHRDFKMLLELFGIYKLNQEDINSAAVKTNRLFRRYFVKLEKTSKATGTNIKLVKGSSIVFYEQNTAGSDVYRLLKDNIREFKNSLNIYKRSNNLDELLIFLFVNGGSTTNIDLDDAQEKLLKESQGTTNNLGVILGHAAGPNLTKTIRVVEYLNKAIDSFKKNGADLLDTKSRKLFDEATRMLDRRLSILKGDLKHKRILSLQQIDGDLELDKRVYSTVKNSLKVEHRLNLRLTVISPESSRHNSVGGAKIKNVHNELVSFVGSVVEDLIDIRSSPSFKEQAFNGVINKFNRKKTASSRTKRNIKLNIKNKSKNKGSSKSTITQHSFGVEPTKYNTTGRIEGRNIASLISFINNRIYSTLKNSVMGKGTAKELLNYRSGRFAGSAEVVGLQFTTSKKSLIADITYQRNPYDVFLPGGKLYKPLRDPTKLIGKSIRQLLAEKKIQGLPVRTRLVS